MNLLFLWRDGGGGGFCLFKKILFLLFCCGGGGGGGIWLVTEILVSLTLFHRMGFTHRPQLVFTHTELKLRGESSCHLGDNEVGSYQRSPNLQPLRQYLFLRFSKALSTCLLLHLFGPAECFSSWIVLTLKTKALCCLEKSRTTHLQTELHIPKDLNPGH